MARPERRAAWWGETKTAMHQRRPDEPYVSVIVPAFNVELFIEQCLRSLFEQSVEPMEIIVVDDGSTDKTRSIVESLTPPEGKFLKLISKPNGGLSSARNAGMKAAQGRWIGFVDADDWVANTMYSVLPAEAESAGADVAISTGVDVDSTSGVQSPSRDIEGWNAFIATHGRQVVPRDCPDLFALDISPCRRVYKREFLKGIGFTFVEGVIFEDLIANYKLLFRTNLAVLVDEPMYFYRVGRDGQITGRKDHTVLDVLRVVNMVIDEMWEHSASAELWANFICVQGWYMLWNCGQIVDEHRERLAIGATRIALKFPPRGLARFRQKFGNDPRITTAVDLQLYGDADLFAEFAQTLNASQRAKKVANSDILRRFFIARAQVTSRFARMSSRRRFRRMGSGLGARSVVEGLPEPTWQSRPAP